MDTETLRANITSGRHWLRLLYMVLFAVLLYVAGLVMSVVVVLQFLFALLSGSANDNLRQFGESLSRYIFQVLQFLTYSREHKPFPFSDWPEGPLEAEAEAPRPQPSPASASPAQSRQESSPGPEPTETADDSYTHHDDHKPV